MPRNRVLSLFSRFENSLHNNPSSPTASTPASPTHPQPPSSSSQQSSAAQQISAELPTKHVTATTEQIDSPSTSTPRHRRSSSLAGSRRNSISAAYQPPTMDISDDTPAELAPIFTYLNSHTNKLYQEGYFLKLHDLDSRGRPSADRVWNECFAQLVGTVLSLWDAAELDAAGEDGEVVPTFINLTDASIKMIESLPMNGVSGQSLQNVLSVSTAANNRYLLHFNSLHSLTQWTAGIRLAMFEHSTLQEAYTGAILAAKGKQLNGIRNIMERTRFPIEDWARVRFGAGTPWRRCWCVISPPDEKEYAKAQKQAKKKSAYERSSPTVKGDIKFYEQRKITKKTRPIATITDAYAAYAIYPQSKPLIDQSTLVKLEGKITIHTNPETTTEGFIFAMPEVHPAVSGFEMMLRWLIPTFDTFALYGRPNRLIADVVDPRSLMFAMPNSKRYGYLELIDVAGLIHTEGSQKWDEREWKKQMKNLTAKRMAAPPVDRADALGSRRSASRSSTTLPGTSSRLSLNLPQSRSVVKFGDETPSRSGTAPSSRHGSPGPQNSPFSPPQRVDSAPPTTGSPSRIHQRAVSDAAGYKRGRSRLSFEAPQENDELASAAPPPPPPHAQRPGTAGEKFYDVSEARTSGESESPGLEPNGYGLGATVQAPFDQPALVPVAEPPMMAHAGSQKPPKRPADMPDMRRANSAIDAATLAQLADSNVKAAGQSKYQESPQAYQSSNQQGPLPNQGLPYRPAAGPVVSQNGNYGPPPWVNGSNHHPNGGPVAYRPAPNTNGPLPQSGGSTLEPPRQRRGPPPPDARKLPTIPGTPAFEQNQFDLQPPLKQNSINRKPVGSGGEYSRSRSRGADGRDASPRPY